MQPKVTIARIIIGGWKVDNLNVELEPRTLLVGANGSGKTAILDAIRVGILGYVPAVGKRLQDVAALMRGRSADVSILLSDGRAILWQIDRSNRGSLSSKTTCSWLPDGATQAEHATAALELVAEDTTTVAEILDARTLIKATPRERTQRIQGFIAAASMSREDRRGMAGEIAVRRLANAVGRAVPAESCYGMIPGTDAGGDHFGQRRAFDAAIDAFLSRADESSAAAIEWANGKKNDAARIAREKKAARDELAARLEELPEVDPSDLAQDRERLAELQRLASVEGYKAERRREQEKARLRAAGELSEAKRAFLQAEADAIDADKAAKAIPHLEAELKAERAWLDGAAEPQPRVPDEIAAHDAEIRRLGDLMGKLASEADAIDVRDPDESPVLNAKRRLAAVRRDLFEAQEDPWHEVIDQCHNIDERHLDARGAKAHARILEIATLRAVGDVKKLLVAVEEEHKALRAAQDAYSDALVARGKRLEAKHALNDEWQATKERLEAAKARRAAVVEPIEREHARALREYQQRREDAVALVGSLEQRIAELRRAAFNAAQAKANASNRVATAERVLADLGEGDTDEPEDYSEQIELLSESIEKRASILAELAGLERIGDELRDAGAARDVYAALEWAAQQVQAEEVRRSGAALRDPIAEIVGRDVYLEPGKTSCEIGWVEDGNRVSVEAMSGGQFALFLAALQAAIVDLRGGELRVVIVETGECDDATLSRIEAGLAGWHGQVIGARWAQPEAVDGWAIVEL